MLHITPIPAFHDNYIWALRESSSDHVVVVDPGDAAPVEAFLRAHDYELAAVLITHHHADHTGGLAALTRERHVPVYGPARETIEHVTHALRDNEVIDIRALGIAPLRVMDVPGHTMGHIAYVASDWVLCGDTLFAMGCGRIFEGTPAMLYGSLQRIAALPSATRAYCTHEYTESNLRFALAVEPNNPALQRRAFEVTELRSRKQPTVPTTIAAERETNPFLRCAVNEVRESAERFAARTLHTEVEVFTVLRGWKNEFR